MVSRACWGGCIGTEPCSDVSQPVGMDSGEDCFKRSGQSEGKHQCGKLDAVGD